MRVFYFKENVMGIKVMAIKAGYYGRTSGEARLYEEKEVFEVDNENQLGAWMVRLDGKENKAEKKALRAKEKLEQSGYAPIDTSKINTTQTASTADKKEAAKKAKQLKAEAEEKAKEEAAEANPLV